MSNKNTILALGADMKNRFLVAKGGDLRFGPDIGDLSDAANYELFKRTLYNVIKNIKPGTILCDSHPGYFSTRFANENGLQLKAYSLQLVQHHHAHIASVMQEYNLKRPVIGVSFDGTGFGTDGNMWGGEFLLVNKKGFKRLAYLKYHMMPGGEKAVTESWRMVLSILGKKGIDFVRSASKAHKEAILFMRRGAINSPLTSSAGRLFDAAAALLGVCERASYEAEGPIKLEAMCENTLADKYEFTVSSQRGGYIIDTKPLFVGMCKDLRKERNKKVIATKFHNSMVDIIIKTVKKLSKDLGLKDIALSGGVFQNKFLREKTVKKLLSSGFSVFINEKSPVNDFNISSGQYYVFSGSCKN